MTSKMQAIDKLKGGSLSDDLPPGLKDWELMQYKSFRKWVQLQLEQRGLSINNLQEELKDGTRLYNLLEILTEKKIGRSIAKPKTRIQNVNNLGICFDYMHKEGVRMENLGVEDIADGNLKLVMGLCWTLVLKYEIGKLALPGAAGGDNKGKSSSNQMSNAKKFLMDWLKCIAHYKGVNITNLTSSFSDGKAFMAMVHLFNNNLVDYDGDVANRVDKVSTLDDAFDLLEEEFGVPRMLDAKDVAKGDPDEKAMMTYLAACINGLEKYAKKKSAQTTGGRTDPSKTYAYGPGAELASTAEPAIFTIQAKDKDGNKVPIGGDKFLVKIKGPDGFIPASVRDNNDGTYTVGYNAKTAGIHNIEISLEGKPISNSPLVVEAEYQPCHLNEASPKWSEAYGAGTEIASTAEPANATIQSKNKYGNNVTKGGDPFKVAIKGPKGTEAKVVDNNDGTYSVTYEAKEPGDYTFDATLKGQSIYNSPHNVTCFHEDGPLTQTDPKWTSVSGADKANTIEPAKFQITAKNKYGNKVPHGGDKFKVDIQGFRNQHVNADIKDNNNGTYDVTYQPTAGGPHNVNVQVLATPIFRSPFTVPVSQVADPSKCVAAGAGTQVASTAEPARIVLQAKDAKGNNLTKGGDKVRVKIAGPAGSQELEAKILDNGDGTYSIEYQPTNPGQHAIDITVNGKPISNGTIRVNADFNTDPNNVADPRWSTAEGAGTELGSTAEPSDFVITTRNKYGNPLKTGGHPFTVDVKPPTGAPVVAKIKDNGDGTFNVSYQATNPGAHDLGVNLAGQPIKNFPKKVQIDKNTAPNTDVDPHWSSAHGPGTVAANTATPANFTVQAKNKYGNNIAKGGAPFTVGATDTRGKPVDATIIDNGNGTYGVTYKPTASGLHHVDVELSGYSINKSPLSVPVTQDTDPSKCKLSGPGTQVASTAEPATFTIQAADKLGNLLNRGGDNFKVKIANPSGDLVEANIKDNKDGTYTVSYQAAVPGKHVIEVSLDGKNVAGSPLTVNADQNDKANEEADPKWSTIEGAGAKIASTAEKGEFTVLAKNKYGNPVKHGGDQFNVELVGPKGAVPDNMKINDNKDGTYTVSYNAKIPGVYTGDVTLKDKSIDKAPFRVDVEQNEKPRTYADPEWSVLQGPGIEGGNTDALAEFQILARNKYGNPVTAGGDDFRTKVKGFRGRVLPDTTLTDNKNGTYNVKYNPVASGSHQVVVTLDGVPLKQSPVAVPIAQTTEPAKSEAKGAGTQVGSTAEPAEFTIQARDKRGNKCNRGGDPFKVAIKGPAGSPSIDAKVRDNHDGTYTVTYQPETPGAHSLDITLHGKPIANGSLKVNVDQNSEPNRSVDPKWSNAEGAGTELASTAEPSDFVVTARNKYGNKVPFGGSDFKVDVKTPSGSPAVNAKVVDKGDGTYAVRYNPLVPGQHTVDVKLGGQPIFETPAKVDVEHNTAFVNEADPRWSEGIGAGTENANTTEPAKFVVQAKNRYGNKVTKGGDDFKIGVKAPHGSGAVDADIVDNNDGTYDVQYQPTASGVHAVDVSLDGWSIHKSPFEVDAYQGTDPSKTIMEGAGTKLASTAEPATFTIQAKDKNGNKLNRGGDKFKASVKTPKGDTIPVLIKDNLDGTYSATYEPNTPGVHNLDVTLGGKPIANSPAKVNVEQQKDPNTTTDPSWSEVNGAGTQIASTAEPAVFTIQAKNKFGNNIKKGGDPFKVDVKGPNGPIPATVKDNGNGTYEVTYQPKVAGLHNIDVTLQGKNLRNCPLKVVAEQNSKESDEVSPKWSTADGPGLLSADTLKPADFTIQARNKYGNPINKAGIDFKVDVKGDTGSRPVYPTVKDNGNGTYAVSYQPNAGGDHTVAVTLGGSPLHKSPHTVPVTQITDPTKSAAEGAGTVIGSTAEPAVFTIQARDAAGNKVNHGGDPFQVKIAPPAGSPPIDAKIKDNHDGTYTVTYIPTHAGVHKIDATLNGTAIANSPYSANIEQNSDVNKVVDPKWSTAEGAGVQVASTAEPSEFLIRAKNKYGNPIAAGGAPFKSDVKGANGATLPVNIKDNNDGTYTCTYQANTPGDSVVNATLNGTPIFNAPFKVQVDKNAKPATEADPTWSTVSGDGVRNANVTEPAEFSVQARNKYGNKLKTGGDNITVPISGRSGRLLADVTDNGDGTYQVSYQPTQTGEHQVAVQLEGKNLRGTPLDVDVKNGACASKSVPFGPGIESAIVGEPATFVVQAKDKNWNNVKAGGDDVKATVAGPNGPVNATVKDNNDGTYQITYTPQVPGYHKVDVKLDGESISDCPRNVPVKQLTDPSKSSLSGPGTESATTTEPATFTITSKDKNGNPLTVGGDEFYVNVKTPAGSKPVLAQVKDNDNGTYSVTYQPSAPGPHQVEVTLDGKTVDRPLNVDVKQFTDPTKSIAYGPGFQEASTGTPATFVVQAKDKNGNNVTRGGDPFQAKLTGPAGSPAITATVKDNGNGTYTVSAQPLIPGQHNLDITLDGKSIANAPATIQVRQDVSPEKSIAYGPGLESANTTEPSSFTVEARDNAGNKVPRGGDKVQVKVSNPTGVPVPAKIKDNKDGTYAVTYDPYSPGNHKIEVLINGQPLGKSPFNVGVAAGEATIMGAFEMDVWREMNKARMNPKLYAQYIRDLLPHYDQSTGAFNVPESDYVRQTNEGRRALHEAINFLETAEPVGALKISEPFSQSCKDLCADLGPKGKMGNIMSDGTDPATRLNKYGRWKNKVGEILSYAAYSPRDVVIGWIVDDGQSPRPNRNSVFDGEFTVVGIASGPHAVHMRMVAAALAGNFVEGDEEARKKREIKVNYEREQLSFSRFETPDKKGYLIPVGKLQAKLENLKLFKEARILHIERTLHTPEGEPLVSDYRYDIPYEFDPISVTAKLNPVTDELSIYLAKPEGALDPNKEVEITSFAMGPNLSRPNEKMDMKSSQSADFVEFKCFSSTSKEEITVLLQGQAMILLAKRHVLAQDEQGEYTNVVTSKRSVKLPFPVSLSAFQLQRQGDEGFTIKIMKPTSSIPPDAKVEIPIQHGFFE